jgi:hypothetical protein
MVLIIAFEDEGTMSKNHQKNRSKEYPASSRWTPWYQKSWKMSSSAPPLPPKHYATVLFPGFKSLDVFGPLDFPNLMSLFVQRHSSTSLHASNSELANCSVVVLSSQ